MAKGKATGLWKGKVGNNVFYKITNSNNAQKQGIRERVIEVSNPKTYYQANQRMKLLPAQRIAGALKEIVERGQQGVKYGALSRNEFLSRALSMKTGFPFMEKSDPNVIPGEYQLTKGTLPEVAMSPFATGQGTDNLSGFATSLIINDAFISAVNFGAECTALIEANPYLQNGDQITSVMFYKNAQGIILYRYKSMILDVDSTDDQNFTGSATDLQQGAGNLCVACTEEGLTAIAAAVIISRANGANGYLRSNATMAVNKADSAIAKYFANKNAALQSYAGDNTIGNNTNWPVDVNDDDPSVTGGFVNISVAEDLPEGISITGTGRYAVGSQVTLRATGDNISEFQNWIVNDVDMARLTENPWTFTAENSMRVSVNTGTAITEP